jgi:hypothetical protein
LDVGFAPAEALENNTVSRDLFNWKKRDYVLLEHGFHLGRYPGKKHGPSFVGIELKAGCSAAVVLQNLATAWKVRLFEVYFRHVPVDAFKGSSHLFFGLNVLV